LSARQISPTIKTAPAKSSAMKIATGLSHRVDRRKRLTVVEARASDRGVDCDRPEQRRRDALGQVELVAVGSLSRLARSIDKGYGILHADILHINGHPGGRISHREEPEARIDVVESVPGEERIARKDIGPMPVRVPQGVRHDAQRFVDDCVTDAEGRLCILVEYVSCMGIRVETLALDDSERGKDAAHLQILGIGVFAFDKAGEQVKGTTVFRIEHVRQRHRSVWEPHRFGGVALAERINGRLFHDLDWFRPTASGP